MWSKEAARPKRRPRRGSTRRAGGADSTSQLRAGHAPCLRGGRGQQAGGACPGTHARRQPTIRKRECKGSSEAGAGHARGPAECMAAWMNGALAAARRPHSLRPFLPHLLLLPDAAPRRGRRGGREAEAAGLAGPSPVRNSRHRPPPVKCMYGSTPASGRRPTRAPRLGRRRRRTHARVQESGPGTMTSPQHHAPKDDETILWKVRGNTGGGAGSR